MAAMTHRERVLRALNHEETDRVPIDFGGTYTTTIYYAAYDRLKKHLGIEHETAIYSKVRRLAVPHESVLRRFDVDTRMLALGAYEGAQRVIDDSTFLDEWGTIWRKVRDGHYLYVDGPFFALKKPGPALLDDFGWPDPDNPGYYRGLRERARALRCETGCAIVLNMPVGVIHQGQFLRGFEDWLKDFYRNRPFMDRLTASIADWWIRVAENALEIVGDDVDIVFFGDDLATQLAPLFDPEVYRAAVKPHHRRMIEAVKDTADVKLLFHSCGAVSSLIEDLIDIGVDAVNPVQVTAKDMEPAHLKERFGDRITFWGGINSQRILPFGTPEDVRREVRRMIDIMGVDGGFVLNSVHNIQNDVSAKNVIAMFDEARRYHPGRQMAAAAVP